MYQWLNYNIFFYFRTGLTMLSGILGIWTLRQVWRWVQSLRVFLVSILAYQCYLTRTLSSRDRLKGSSSLVTFNQWYTVNSVYEIPNCYLIGIPHTVLFCTNLSLTYLLWQSVEILHHLFSFASFPNKIKLSGKVCVYILLLFFSLGPWLWHAVRHCKREYQPGLRGKPGSPVLTGGSQGSGSDSV